MKLRISQINIKNFKAIQEIIFYTNSHFNIIIGENNIGKSTIFEAIQLWEKCYINHIQEKNKGAFYSSSSMRYLNHYDLFFLRTTHDYELFYNQWYWNPIEITLTLLLNDQSYNLGFNIAKPKNIQNSYFRIQPIDGREFTRFSEVISQENKKLDEVIFIYQTRPIAIISQNEPYHNEAQVKSRIQRGLSHEVLRSKIISKRETISNLELNISKIIGKTVKFEMPHKNREKTDEFIKLKVSFNQGAMRDIHLQGSGFLQITEIVSTIDYIDTPLKILLVDEPDSHIHTRLQYNLLENLRNIDHNQFFIISHNDQFVSNSNDEEIFFLSDTTKQSKQLKPIPSNSFDVIKKAMGGVILSLEQLNQAEHIVFVEGQDDEAYIKKLAFKYSEVTLLPNSIQKFKFFPLRGKDNITSKIEYNKRTLSNLFKEKRWITVFDKDFSTDQIDSELKNILMGKMGRNSIAFSHDGYCIEGSLFSDIDKTCKYFQKLLPNIEADDIRNAINTYLDSIKETINKIDSNIYQELNTSFLGQRNNRSELGNLEFSQIIIDWYNGGQPKVQNLMTKYQINKLINSIEEKLGQSLFLRSSNTDDEVASKLFNKYIDHISHENDICPAHINLLSTLGIINIVDAGN